MALPDRMAGTIAPEIFSRILLNILIICQVGFHFRTDLLSDVFRPSQHKG